MLQVFRKDGVRRDVRVAGAVVFCGNRARISAKLADRPGHGRAAGGQEDAAEDAQEAHAAAAPVRENGRAAVRGERVRLRGQERVSGHRPCGVDRVQRRPLAAGHSGRAGGHVQLPGAQDLHTVVRSPPPVPFAASQRQRRRPVRRQARQRHQRHYVLAQPHVGPRPFARLNRFHDRTRSLSIRIGRQRIAPRDPFPTTSLAIQGLHSSGDTHVKHTDTFSSM